MAFNFKFLMRGVVAMCYTGIYAHQALTIDAMFGLTTITIVYLLALFSFYLFVFISQFLKTYVPDYDFQEVHKECHGVQIILLLFSLALTFFEVYETQKTITTDKIILMVFTDFLIAFPEYVIHLINKIINKKR